MSRAWPGRIVVASGNVNKIKELQTVAAQFELELLSPVEAAALRQCGSPPQVEETSDSYYGNALLKAQAFARWSGLPAIGDDSGLEVSVLGDRPGVFSARYGGEGLDDRQRCRRLLEEVERALGESAVQDRSARFRCCLVLAHPDGETLQAEGVLEGELLTEFRGENGFGYDPVVLIHDLGRTLAEVDFSVICDAGFRAQAARRLFAHLA